MTRAWAASNAVRVCVNWCAHDWKWDTFFQWRRSGRPFRAFPVGGGDSHGVAVGWRGKCTFGAPRTAQSHGPPAPRKGTPGGPDSRPSAGHAGHAATAGGRRQRPPPIWIPARVRPYGAPFWEPTATTWERPSPHGRAPTGHPSRSPRQRRGERSPHTPTPQRGTLLAAHGNAVGWQHPAKTRLHACGSRGLKL